MNMKLLRHIGLALGFTLSLMLTSCWSEDMSGYSDDAIITSFYLYSDSIDGITSYTFTIDEDEKRIYNTDSIDFGTEVDSLMPIISPTFWQIYVNDTIDFGSGDSTYLDFTDSLTMTVWASDKETTQTYTVIVNVHQVDPDTFIWTGMNTQVFYETSTCEKAFYLNDYIVYLATLDGTLYNFVSYDAAEWSKNTVTGLPASANDELKKIAWTEEMLYYYSDDMLYTSTDGTTWTSTATTGDIDYLLFNMNSELYGIDEANGNIVRFDGSQWVVSSEVPSDEFPVSGATIYVGPAPSGKTRAFLLGGIDASGNFLSSVWSTEDGAYWVDLGENQEYFTPRADAAVVQYASGLMLFGGRDADGVVTTETHLFSNDYGVTWVEPEDKMMISSLYITRYDHSAVAPSSGYLYLLGGRTRSDNSVGDVWQGLRYASLPGFLY